MSTILKTLRKLEEEKNILDQKLDLKEMLLQEETIDAQTIQTERRTFFIILSVVVVLFIAGGIIFYQSVPTDKITTPAIHIPAKILHQSLSKDSSKLGPFEGVSMSVIPSEEEILKPTIKEADKFSTSNNLEKTKRPIKSTTTLKKNSTIAPLAIQNGYIPNVKVKGIIFFGKGSLSNHIIITSKNNSNLKLQVGNSIQSAVLKNIHPSHVIFLYQDQMIKVGIGQ
jgi:hypothetical protein|tara:strand:+ start:981 stop:1658 length:678 start_codon:yes stop_codon:yes gene_type:complete